jgi:hypothetical protein
MLPALTSGAPGPRPTGIVSAITPATGSVGVASVVGLTAGEAVGLAGIVAEAVGLALGAALVAVTVAASVGDAAIGCVAVAAGGDAS